MITPHGTERLRWQEIRKLSTSGETTGRNRIRELSLDPKSQSDFIYDALFPDHSPIEIEEE